MMLRQFLQVLTHVKEKLQYIEKENEALQVSSSVCPVLADLSVSPLPAEQNAGGALPQSPSLHFGDIGQHLCCGIG